MIRHLGRLLLGLFSLGAMAATPVEVGKADRQSLAGHMEILEGRQASSLAEALQAASEGRFVPLPGNVSKGYGKEDVWVRFTINGTSDPHQEGWLEVGPSYTQEVTLHVPKPGGGYVASTAGAWFPFQLREVPYLNPVFRFGGSGHPLSTAPATCYLQLRTRSARILEPVLWKPAAFQAVISREFLLFGAFFGIALIIMLTNLLYWLRLREPVQIQYAGYLATMVLLFATIAGFAKQFLLPDSAASLSIWMPLAMAVHPWLAVLLFSTLTEFGSAYPRLDRGYRRLSLALTILFLLVSLTGHYYDIAALEVGSLLLIVLVNLAGAWAMSLRQNRAAWLYGLAFGPYLLGALFRLTFLFGWLSSRFLGEHAMQVAAIFHIILMNFPLAERLGRIKKERDQALLAALEATERSQRELEAQVEERTRELKEEQARTSAALDHERMIVQEQQQFLSLVSHEFRTPLAVMDGAAQMARLSVDPAPPELTRSTQSIQQGVSNLLHLLDTWLTTDRIASGLRALKTEPVALPALLTEVVKRAADISRRDLRAELDDLPATTHCDRDLLSAALLNLLDNAIKYSPVGSPVSLRAQVREGCLHLEVRDKGKGIPVDQLQQIATRYSRGRNVGQIPGLGLGLHLVRTIAKLHGGRLEVESTEGQGTTARLVLPVQGAASACAPHSAQAI